MKTTEKNYKAFIAGTRWSVPFDYAYGRTKSAAIAAVKRKNSPDWKDCCIWCAYVHERRNGVCDWEMITNLPFEIFESLKLN